MKRLLIVALAMPLAFAGPPPPVPTMHAESRVVQIDVVVTDLNGKPVTDLTKQDFAITDEGKSRATDIFSVNRGLTGGDASVITAKPLLPPLPPNVFSNRNTGPPNLPGHSTVIVLDQDSYNPSPAPGARNTFEDTAYAQLQVIDLMSKVKPDEQIALYVMARKEGLVILQDYTTNRELLLRSLKNYIPRAMSTPAATHPDKPGPGSQRRDPNEVPARETESLRVQETREVRLSFQALAEHLAIVPGRKSVFWVTEGFAPFRMRGMEKMGWDKTITALNAANVAVNAVDSVALTPAKRPPNALEEIADRTGGQSWLIRNDLGEAMAEGIEASRTTYTLGFYLSDSERDGHFHQLKVKADRPGLQLYYRQGYYAGNTELPDSSTDKGELESALLNQVNSTGIGITARIATTPGSARGTLDIWLNLQAATLSLSEKAGGWAGDVEEMFVQTDARGHTLAKVSDKKEFEVTAPNRAGYDSQGVSWPMSIPLVNGAAKLTIVVRDSKTEHLGSLTIPLP